MVGFGAIQTKSAIIFSTGWDDRSTLSIQETMQRLEITEKYQNRYSKSVFIDFRGDLRGNFLQLMSAMFQPLPTFFATAIYNSVKNYGTADEVLTGVDLLLSS
ncbi:unnamed protein product [Orchesella dallaii]|uniref:Uncharacterized protein n=1 Tax=Orchesella dallaii TaxID=48710 RepID=A0ABP1RQX5_9HEXA